MPGYARVCMALLLALMLTYFYQLLFNFLVRLWITLKIKFT